MYRLMQNNLFFGKYIFHINNLYYIVFKNFVPDINDIKLI